MSTTVTAELVVVGGGSAGAALTGRLAEAGRDVVLVEAGPDYGPLAARRWPAEIVDATALALTHDWGYGSGPVPGREPWTYERARIMGGCSAHNGAIAAVGHHSDYDGWGLAGWRTDDLRPLFAAVLDRMRVRTYRRDEAGPFHARALEAAAAAGWHMAEDLCDLDANDSFGLESVNVVGRVRWNTAFAYLDPVRGRANLRIIDRAIVDRLTWRAGGATVHARRDGQPLEIDAATVVLSAGVYGTPAILQRSGVGDPARLAAAGVSAVHALPGVGANLHDHPMVFTDRVILPELQARIDEEMAAGFVPEEQTLGKALSSLATDGIFDLHVFPVCASTQVSITNGNALGVVAGLTPRSRGRVDIVAADPEVHPRIDTAFLTDPEGHDITLLRDGLVMANDLFAQPALRAVLGAVVTDTSTDDAIRREVVHYYHPVGTTRMGSAHDPMAVCDERGRVYGLDQVVVADVSLMPQIPRANTNIPAVMIGERLASWLS